MEDVQLKKPDENGWYVFHQKEIVTAETVRQIVEDINFPERANGIFQDFVRKYQLLTWINDKELIAGNVGFGFTKVEPRENSPYGDILFCVGDVLFQITPGHKLIELVPPK